MARPIIIEIRANARQATQELNRVSSALTRFGGQMRGISGLAAQSMTGIRQMAQGVQNLGFVLSAFVALPVANTMKNIAEQALTFERSMVEVQKTTGLSAAAIGDMATQVRELSKQTPTAAIELAKMAAEAGRVGVGMSAIMAGDINAAIAQIMEFVRVVDMMQISTVLGTEEAAQAFGRLISVFKDLDVSNIENLGSTINELGQSASVNEEQIVSALLRVAPAAAGLDIAAEAAVGLATAITQVSESASRGGTRLRVALEQMAINYI